MEPPRIRVRGRRESKASLLLALVAGAFKWAAGSHLYSSRRNAVQECPPPDGGGAASGASRASTSPPRAVRARVTSASSPAPAARGRSTRSPTSPACASDTRPLVAGDTVRTGVTAILPHGGNLFREKVPGAVFVGNAFGKLAGSTQVQELGTIESPIVLTNTLGVGVAVDAVVRWTLAQPGNENVRSVNALVGETNDGGLNDIRGLHVTREHVASAITRRETARSRKARSAPARARSRSDGRAASARRRGGCASRTTSGPSACWSSRTTAAASRSPACRCGRS